MPIEQEIRLTASDAAVLEEVLGDPLVTAAAVGPARDTSFVATYSDTLERALLRTGLAFRARRLEHGRRVGIKGFGAVVAGVAIREEWEQAFDGPLVRFGDLPPGEVRDRVVALTGPEAPLVELLVTAIQRRVVELRLQGCRAELALDAGQVRAGGRCVAIHEVEVELLAGELAPMARFAAALARRHGLRPAHHSKFTLGLSLL